MVTGKKYGAALLAPSGKAGFYNMQGVDCPFVFRHRGEFYMLHVGFDGIGYRTALARSRDLLHWEHYAVLFGDDSNPLADSSRKARQDPGREAQWDASQDACREARRIAGVWILREKDLRGEPVLKKAFGNYWMVTHTYPGIGYEAGPATIRLAWTQDETLRDWHMQDSPALSWEDGADWEKGGLYKGCLLEHEGTFWLFYNAKNRDLWPWTEQIGAAFSKDLRRWERYPGNPVLRVKEGAWDSRFVSDPFVVRDGEIWKMYYYGYDGNHAQEGLAWSKDLLHWEKAPDPILRAGAPGEIDSMHAHKPCVILHDHQLVHFYCAVREARPEDGTAVRTETDENGAEHAEYRSITAAGMSI